jgi:hypothetical protein
MNPLGKCKARRNSFRIHPAHGGDENADADEWGVFHSISENEVPSRLIDKYLLAGLACPMFSIGIPH